MLVWNVPNGESYEAYSRPGCRTVPSSQRLFFSIISRQSLEFILLLFNGKERQGSHLYWFKFGVRCWKPDSRVKRRRNYTHKNLVTKECCHNVHIVNATVQRGSSTASHGRNQRRGLPPKPYTRRAGGQTSERRTRDFRRFQHKENADVTAKVPKAGGELK